MVKGKTFLDRIRKDMELLSRHIMVFKAVEEHQPIGIMRLSHVLHYPQHHIRYSLRLLEKERLIVPSPRGALITKRAQDFREKLRVLLDEMKHTVEMLRSSI